MDWDDLRFFLAVAREGSLSAAARSLNVTQPTVGRRIAAFEKTLGARLFAPIPQGQVLSATGRRMLACAERMEIEATSVQRMASGRDAGLRGRVCVTASDWLINSALAGTLAWLSARHPELEIELLSDTRHLSLVKREADIAVRPSPFEQAEVLQRQVAILSFGLYASDGYLAVHGVPDFSRGCSGHTLIAMSESLTRIPDVEWLPRLTANARVVARTNGREPMVALASSGLGLACLPRFLGDRAPGLRLLPTTLPGPVRKLWLGMHRDTRGVPRVKATFGFLTETFRRLAPALCPPPAGQAVRDA